jgi:histidine triad (HIT) family protein
MSTPSAAHDPNCVFCKIVAGQIPSRKAHEDDELVVFHDIAPWAPVHLLIVPKRHIASMMDVTPADAALLGRMMTLAPKLMKEAGVTNGYRLVVNTGADGGQEVMHLHLHAFGGPRPWAKG